ncbi:IclR family transcriptional regulator C-terminal domain-containing protein [uncultured Thalassospira sp.]|jgi:IclR family pca regulon transcriptional regulator|uniref:IclR family transcriptional regulator n=1 Tax=uncultured Thalassospira sp. TaxID=404382 RepID=UPI0030DD98A4|tara:strand:+ start:4119 stop:4871 length:753 start_codon:yes stop_codon:yes gene_type:complete
MSGRGSERILEVIEWLARQPAGRTLTEVVAGLALPKSSALMLLRTLVERGYARRDDAGLYHIHRLPGEASADNRAWGTILRLVDDSLREAVSLTHETGFVGVLDDAQKVRYLNKILPQREIRYDRDISVARIAAHVATGQVLLSGLSDAALNAYCADLALARDDVDTIELITLVRTIRTNGYSVNLQGRVEGAAGVAAPIFDRHGNMVAALNIAGPRERIAARQDEILSVVITAAQQASAALSEMRREGP